MRRHSDWDTPGFELEPVAPATGPFPSRPFLEVLWSHRPHPAGEFGCTVCHGGRGRALDFSRAAHEPAGAKQREEWRAKHGWRRTKNWPARLRMLPGPGVQASCAKCHPGRRRLDGAERWARGGELYRKYGCFGCHDTRGFAKAALIGPDLRQLPLKYGAGDYNCLHQDLYGEHVFPLQVAFLLSRPGDDFTGGEFVLTEQRPRMQSRAEMVPLTQGEGVIFPVHHRPVAGTRGTYRVNMRHGVSRLRSGQRHTLGIIFHDAK